MTNTAMAAGPTAAPKPLPARLIGVLTSPMATFQAIVMNPKWFGALAVTTLLIAFFSALPMTTDAGRQATLDQQVSTMKSFGVEVDDRMYDQLERKTANLPYTTAASVIVISPIIALIVAGLLFAVFNAAMGGEASFKQVYSVIAHAGVVSMLGATFSGTINYFRGATGSVANLGALLPMLPEKSFLGSLLGTIDVFLVWYVVVLAIGLAVLYRRRTQPIALALVGVYAVIALGIALVKSRVGGA
jgi:membrane protein, antimicrobial resistance system